MNRLSFLWNPFALRERAFTHPVLAACQYGVEFAALLVGIGVLLWGMPWIRTLPVALPGGVLVGVGTVYSVRRRS